MIYDDAVRIDPGFVRIGGFNERIAWATTAFGEQGGNWDCIRNADHKPIFFFMREEDAMMFRLRWE